MSLYYGIKGNDWLIKAKMQMNAGTLPLSNAATSTVLGGGYKRLLTYTVSNTNTIGTSEGLSVQNGTFIFTGTSANAQNPVNCVKIVFGSAFSSVPTVVITPQIISTNLSDFLGWTGWVAPLLIETATDSFTFVCGVGNAWNTMDYRIKYNWIAIGPATNI